MACQLVIESLKGAGALCADPMPIISEAICDTCRRLMGAGVEQGA
jgi:hypothetical protein